MKTLKGQILSADQAAQEASVLKSIVSQDVYLALNVLIYIASLLEKIADQNQPTKIRTRRKTEPTAWAKFLSVELRSGAGIKAAAAKWAQQKSAASTQL